MSAETLTTTKPEFKYYRSPKTIISRFVARRTVKSASLWAFIFGIYMAEKTLAYAKLAPNHAAREKIAASFSSNVGLNALLGTPHKIDTLQGYANWNSLGVITIVASIWAFLLATKYFRGEEDNGRSEILFSGQTTARKGAINILVGLSSSFLIMFVITAMMFIEIGKSHTLNFSLGNSLFFALASVSGAAIFLSVGAFTSQLMPTRSRASSLAAAIFGVFFLIRAMADVSSLHWLLNFTPLGWIERLQPLVGSQLIWFLPIFGSTALLCIATVWFAGRRDLGESTFADNDSSKPHTLLLNTPFSAAFRLTRSGTIGWLIATAITALFYGVLTKAATQAFSQSGSFQNDFNKVLKVSHVSIGLLYLGIVYLLLMSLVMAYVASSIGKVREDEADGYVDNFLVRPVSRIEWLGGRIFLIGMVSVLACLLGGLSVWAGQALQHNGLPLRNLMEASVNMIAPALFTLGAAVFTLGLRPRLTSVVAYGVLGWSFLLALMASGLNINHWLLDTSVLHQVTLAPATNSNWHTDAVMIIVGIALCLIGIMTFNKRDLQSE